MLKRYAWFEGENGAGSGSSAGTQNTENMIPQSRFNEVNERARKAEEALAKLQGEAQAAEQARLAEQGQFQTLATNAQKEAESLKPFKARAEAYEGVIIKANEQLIAQIPEDVRDIVPQLPPHELYAWLNANVARLQKRLAPNIDAGAGGAGGSGQPALTEDEKLMAKNVGMTEKEFLEAKQKAAKARP